MHCVENVAGKGPTFGGNGGGLAIRDGSAVSMNGNTIQDNQAGTQQSGLGGGLYVEKSDLTLTGNQLITNTATLDPGMTGAGGGLYTGVGTSITLTNNVVAGNKANTNADGLFLSGGSTAPTTGRLLYTTIADNFGSGKGVSLANYATLALTNTIIAGHPGTGIWAGTTATATLEATLWYGNGTDTGGTGTIDTGTVNVYGDPAFVDPSSWDFHVNSTSAAINEGVDAGVVVDMDGEARPFGPGYDIGADEYVATSSDTAPPALEALCASIGQPLVMMEILAMPVPISCATTLSKSPKAIGEHQLISQMSQYLVRQVAQKA